MSEDFRSSAGRGVARRTLLKSGAVLAGAIAAPAIVSRSALSSSGEVNFMGWAGYDFTRSSTAFTKKTGIKVNFTEQPDNESIFAQAKLSLQTGAVDFCEPTVDRVAGYVENGIVQPWDVSKINLDGFEPGLVTGQAGEMAQVGGKRYFLPASGAPRRSSSTPSRRRWNTARPASATCSTPSSWARSRCGRTRRWPPWAATWIARASCRTPSWNRYTNMDVMRQNWDIILAEAIKAKANIAQFWKGENEAQAAFRTNGCVLGQCWDSTGFNLQKDGLRSPILPRRKARSPGTRATCS